MDPRQNLEVDSIVLREELDMECERKLLYILSSICLCHWEVSVY